MMAAGETLLLGMADWCDYYWASSRDPGDMLHLGVDLSSIRPREHLAWERWWCSVSSDKSLNTAVHFNHHNLFKTPATSIMKKQVQTVVTWLFDAHLWLETFSIKLNAHSFSWWNTLIHLKWIYTFVVWILGTFHCNFCVSINHDSCYYSKIGQTICFFKNISFHHSHLLGRSRMNVLVKDSVWHEDE